MTNRRLLTGAAGKQTPIDSENEELDFLSIRIGPDKLKINQLDANTFQLNGKRIRIADGSNIDDASTKGQLDTAVSNLQTQITNNNNSLQSQIDTINDDIGDLQSENLSQANDIDALQDDIAAILANEPQREIFDLVTDTTLITLGSITFDPSQSKFDIEVYHGQGWLLQGRDFIKVGNNQIQFQYTIPASAQTPTVVTVWKRGTSVLGSLGGGGGMDWSEPVDAHIVPALNNVYNLGSPSFMFKDGYFAGKLTVLGGIDPEYLQLVPLTPAQIATVPAGSFFIDESDNKMKMKEVVGGGSSSLQTSTSSPYVKSMKNVTGSTIAANTPVALLANGTIATADSDGFDNDNVIGITEEQILNNAFGKVALIGRNMPGAVATLGFTSGDQIYLSENGGYTNDINSFTGNNDKIIRIGIAHCPDGQIGSTATDLIMAYAKLASQPGA